MELDPLLGRKLGSYLIQNKIGEGGMSRVYKGYHTRLRRDVAIKVILSEIAASADFRARFEREAQLIASLEHPNIVTIYDFGESKDIIYLVMQHVSGGTLRDRLHDRQPIEPRLSAYYALQMARSLHHAHLHGIVHRDVKPQNMLISSNDPDTLLLSDFGIAKLFDTKHEATWTGPSVMNVPASHSVTKVGQIVGTAEYMAPEQANQQPVDARTDVYALGVVLFQMLTGRVPFQSTSFEGLLYQHTHISPPSVREINPIISEPLAQITAQALAKSPAARFQSADAMAQALEVIVSSSPTVRTGALDSISYQYSHDAITDIDKTCPNCGAKLDSNSSFCPRCAYSLLKEPAEYERTQFSIKQLEVQNISYRSYTDNVPTIINSILNPQNLPVSKEEAKPTKILSTQNCPFCSVEIRQENDFCPNCGNRLFPVEVRQVLLATSESVPASFDTSPGGNSAAHTADIIDKIENPARFLIRDDQGEREYVLDKLEVVIGRVPNSDILFAKDRLTSRRHAVIRYENGDYLLCDEQSATGTFVNGQELEELTPYILKDGDCVGIGDHELIFFMPFSSSINELPTIVVPEENDGGTIGTRFGLTIEDSFSNTSLLADKSSHVQMPIEESEPSGPDVSTNTSANSTLALDQTIMQLLEEGENHYRARRYEDALVVYTHIVHIDPRNVLAYGNKGNVLGRLRQYKESLIAYNAALDIDAKHVSIWNAKGDVLVKLKRYEEALKAYNAALAIKPTDALTLMTKGDVLSRLKRYEEALASCNQALSINSSHAHTWITKGNVLLKLRRHEEALVAYSAALAINPKDASTWITKGNVLLKLERYEEALSAYTCATELVPRKPHVWAAKGEVLLQLKRYEEALIAYERSQILNPGDPAISRKCTLLRDLKRHKDELIQVQAKEKSPEPQIVKPSEVRESSNNGIISSSALPIYVKDQEQEELFEPEAHSAQVVENFDIFLSYSDSDTQWIEWIEDNLANRLEDEHDFRVWLPKWRLIPGMPWQLEWDRAGEQSRCYAICISAQTSIDWFKQEVQRALKRKHADSSSGVVAVLLPDAQELDVDDFTELNTWVDFCNLDHAYAFHVLVCGVKGIPPGPPPKTLTESTNAWTGTIAEVRLLELQQFKQGKLIDDSVAQEFQRIILKKIWLDVDESKG